MYCNAPDPLDVVISKMQTDLFCAGKPDPVDVLAWAVVRFSEPASAADMGIWFARHFLPVAKAAIVSE